MRLLIIAAVSAVMILSGPTGITADAATDSSGWTPANGMPSITGVKVTVKNGKQLTLKWNAQKACDGYQIQYCRNILYYKTSRKNIRGGAVSSTTLNCPNTSQRYYTRIRGTRTYGGKTYYTRWVPVNTGNKPSTASIQTIVKNGRFLDVQKQGGLALRGYDILQGTCTDGRNLYMAFEKRNGDESGKKRAMIKIVRLRLSDFKITGISPTGQILGHANDITYNPYKNQLVVTGAKVNDPYVRTVSPQTLKRTAAHRIRLGSSFSEVEAFNAIDFDSKTRTYMLRSRMFEGWCFRLDQNFKVQSAVRCYPMYPKRHIQGSTYIAGLYMVPQSWYQSTKQNTITIYNKDGKRMQNIIVKMSGEIESIFFAQGQFYGTVYKRINNQKKAYIIKIFI